MEKARGCEYFFFARANTEIGAVFKRCASRFKSVFRNDGKVGEGTFGKSLGSIVTGQAEGIIKLYRQIILEGDPSKEAMIEHVGIFDYLSQLEDAIVLHNKTVSMNEREPSNNRTRR